MKKIVFIFSFFCLFIMPFSSFANDYDKIDEYAKETPRRYDDDLRRLVRHLIEPFENNNDEAKARVIFAWIVYHIDYDHYRMEAIEKKRGVERNDIFETRSGVCGDIAGLYLEMAELAGLDVKYISGLAKDEKASSFSKEDKHAWNEVKIRGRWEYVDATWGLGGAEAVFRDVNSKLKYKSAMRDRIKRRNEEELFKARDIVIENKWFKVDKELMKRTHKKEGGTP